MNNQSKLLLLTIIGIILASGCIQEEIVNAKLNAPFQLKFGQEALIENESLQIRFLNVTEDSRCPSGVQCIWEGQATVVVQAIKGEIVRNVSLTIRGEGKDGSDKEFDGYEIKLVNLAPYPEAGSGIAPSSYTATLIVSKEDDDKKFCEIDSDCAPATCCHPTDVVNKEDAPDCRTAICTAVCMGPLDCGAGEIKCVEKTCRIVPA